MAARINRSTWNGSDLLSQDRELVRETSEKSEGGKVAPGVYTSYGYAGQPTHVPIPTGSSLPSELSAN